MPELPEVETVTSQLNKKIVPNQLIKSVAILRKRNIRKGANQFTDIVNRQIIDVFRRGKYIIIKLDQGMNIVVHLRMTGQLLYEKKDAKPDKYVRAILYVSSGDILFRDIRTFGTIDYLSDTDLENELKKIGIEPLSQLFDQERLLEICKKKKAPIKQVLLNQKYIAGIGNIYASEILFESLVDPQKKAEDITRDEARKIVDYTKRILKKAIKEKGCSDNTYRDIYNQKGNFNNFLKVYRKNGEKCIKCRKATVIRIVQGGRSTFMCPHCQK